MLYRVMQFLNCFTAVITQEDMEFCKQYLTEPELKLFWKMRRYDQKHSIRVASILREEGSSEEMIRLGLLHDIGKLVYPLNPFMKAGMVVLDKLCPKQIKKCQSLSMVQGYYEHPALGVKLLKDIGNYDKEFLSIIKAHHKKNILEKENFKLWRLQKADERA